MIKKIINKIKKYFMIDSDTYGSFNMLSTNLKYKYPKADIYISDAQLKLVPSTEVHKALRFNLFSARSYKKEINDCENYAYAFKGLTAQLFPEYAFALIFCMTPNGAHALNGFVDEFLNLWYIEPQNNTFFKTKDYKPYLIIV